ncbi:uncharacterized protein [Amphiura filiformis]|uniref:uncharacterized protein n=1 Tax=Amphiura filiformis TaxID=82378 RepID=UPI003B223FE9
MISVYVWFLVTLLFPSMVTSQVSSPCVPNPCLNSAACINRVTTYECVCSDGFTGTQCEQETASCIQALGLETGEITDAQLSATTQRGTFFSVFNARLNLITGFTNAGGWSAFTNDANQWVQVNLLSQKEVTGVITQGRQDADEWVTRYRVQYSVDAINWQYVLATNTQPQIFVGNTDRNTAVTNFFVTSLTTQYIRINPTEWNNHISMRMELLGCQSPAQISNQCSTLQPCQNNANCVDLADGSYSCACLPGYIGTNCETVSSQCIAYQPCLNGAQCVDTANGGFTCACIGNFQGPLCAQELPEPCESNPCINQGICSNTLSLDGYTCTCQRPWRGKNCETADYCVYHPCTNGATCNNINGGLDFTCSCLNGWTGKTCNTVDPCQSDPCFNQGTCVTIDRSDLASALYTCTCPSGWVGTRCEIVERSCTSQPCLNGGQCLDDSLGGFSCNCAVGYTGARCEEIVPACDDSINPCQNGAQCVTMDDGSAICVCAIGYSGAICDQVIPPCEVSLNPCQNGALCMEVDDQAVCICTEDFAGVYCETAISPCESNPCLNGALCFDNDGGFMCECTDGFRGITCEQVVRPCDDGQNPCKNGATCVEESPTSVLCLCAAGYDGQFCQNMIVGPCISNPCINGGTCYENEDTGFTCRCQPQYTGELCEQNNINPCEDMPCRNGGTCVPDGLTAYCICSQQFVGTQCLTPVDYCGSNPCENGGTCVPEYVPLGPYTCNCAQNFTGEHCQLAIKGGCESGPCQNGGSCWGTKDRGYVCTCMDGYTGHNCEEETCLAKACLNNGECKRLGPNSPNYNTPYCECSPLWKGKFCDTPTVSCYPNPCYNDGVCRIEDGNITCICVNGFQGDRCQRSNLINFDAQRNAAAYHIQQIMVLPIIFSLFIIIGLRYH